MKNKILIIIQARMGSSRLPGKVLKDLGGMPLVLRLVESLSQTKKNAKIIVATSTNEENDVLEKILKKHGVDVFRGSENNVLNRFAKTIRKYSPDLVVRATADDPLMPADCMDILIDNLVRDNIDYTYMQNMPYGTTVEVVKASVLLDLDLRNDLSRQDREHVTKYIADHPDEFKVKYYDAPMQYCFPDLSFTIDTEEEYLQVKTLYEIFGNEINLLKAIELRKKKIAIWVYATNSFGFGHLYRESSFYKEIVKFTNAVILCNDDVSAISFLKEHEINHYICNTAAEVNRYCQGENIDLILIDKTNTMVEDLQLIQSNEAMSVVLMDDVGEGASYADMLINAICDLPSKCPERSYQGMDYFIFDDKFDLYREKSATNSKIKKVLMSFGGSDPNNIAELVIGIVKRNRDVQFDIVLGPGYLNVSGFYNDYKDIENLTILHNVDNMAELIYQSDLCVVSGGITMFECAYLKKKIVVACQVEHQILNADKLKQRYDLINLGIIDKENTKALETIQTALDEKIVFKNQYSNFTNGKYKVRDLIIDLLMNDNGGAV